VVLGESQEKNARGSFFDPDGIAPQRTKTPVTEIVLIGNMGIGRRRALMFAATALLAAASCAKRKKTRVPAPARVGTSETGIASWYGNPYHGRRAANGEIYDMEKLTAAHRTLPFNTWVEVTNLTNGRKVRVRITDRGPFVDGRIIDLSRAAAREIEMIGPGVVKVRLEVVGSDGLTPAAPAGLDTGTFAVQIGAYLNRPNAERLVNSLKSRYRDCRLVRRDGETILWRVLIGREPSEAAVRELAETLREEFGTAFVVRVDETAADGL
jgi:rare lipoprotein A